MINSDGYKMQELTEDVTLPYLGYNFSVKRNYWYCIQTGERLITPEQEEKVIDDLKSKHDDFITMICCGFSG